jgi:hypothetical protein
MRKVFLILFFVILCNYVHAQKIRVKENSKLAKLAARIKKEDRYAVTFGKTIFISCTKEEFFADSSWLRHELTHVEQYKRHGMLRFLALYLVYSVFHEYSEIPFEKEAIAAAFHDE